MTAMSTNANFFANIKIDCSSAAAVVVLNLCFIAFPVNAETKMPAPYPGDVPAFIEEAETAGINHSYDGPWEYFVGGGLATFDCNGDRLPDLYLAGGENSAALYVNVSMIGGALQFTRLPAANTDLQAVTGAYPINLDNDEYVDLVILRVGENRMLKGEGNCRFSTANAVYGFAGGVAWTTGFAATFEENRTFPTLAFANYIDRSAPGSPWGTCEDNVLLRASTDNKPESDAKTISKSKQTALPRYDSPLPLLPGHCALSMLFTDWNKSGADALRIANDRQYYRGGEEQLWRLDSGQYPRLYGRSDGWESLVIWGMGIAEGDLDADGFPEYALTSMGDTKLQQLDRVQATEENRPAYDDVAWDLGATAHRPYFGGDLKPSTGWHAEFEDINNDARLDLFIAKGNVESMNDFARFDPDNLLLGSEEGRFSEQGELAGLALNRRGRGASVVDMNADGLLDIVVLNRGDALSLFRQTGVHGPDGPRISGNWIKIELSQKGSNPQAIGARLAVRTGNKVQMRRVQIGGGHASGDLGFIHFGLGVAERATLRVQWPDGQWSAEYRLFANHHVIITRDDEHFSYWFPPEAQ